MGGEGDGHRRSDVTTHSLGGVEAQVTGCTNTVGYHTALFGAARVMSMGTVGENGRSSTGVVPP